MLKKILVLGAGGIGGNAIELLARTQGIDRLYLLDKDKDRGRQRVNSAIYGAQLLGFRFGQEIEFICEDIVEEDRVAKIITKIKPDVILSAITLQSWQDYTELKELAPEMMTKLRENAGLGIWLPSNLAATYKIALAIEKSGISTHHVVASSPDVICPVLKRLDLSPTVGLGNMSLIQTVALNVIARQIEIPLRDLTLWMIGHHAMAGPIFSKGKIGEIPYWVKIYNLHQDITDQVKMDQVFLEMSQCAKPILRLGPNQMYTASDAVRNILAIIFDTNEIVHAPGPSPGLPGGYPVRLSTKGAKVVLPKGIYLEKAIRINEEAAKFDGVKKIEDDGSVEYTQQATDTIKEILGVEIKILGPKESYEKAQEIATAYKKLLQKFRNKRKRF